MNFQWIFVLRFMCKNSIENLPQKVNFKPVPKFILSVGAHLLVVLAEVAFSIPHRLL